MSAVADSVNEQLAELIGDLDPTTAKGRRRRAILDEATRMFAELGYRATSMDEIAAAVGVAKGTLYLYFPKKIQLLLACIAREKATFVPRLLGILEADVPADERLEQYILTGLMLATDSPLLSRLLERDAEMLEILADTPPELIANSEDKYTELVGPLLDEIAGPDHRLSSVELRDRATVIRSLFYLAPLLRHEWMRPGLSPERFAAILAQLVVGGLRGGASVSSIAPSKKQRSA